MMIVSPQTSGRNVAPMSSRAPIAIDDDEVPLRKCNDCGRTSPAGVSEYTLIGSGYGWRLTKGASPDGEPILEWHCSECFAKRRSEIERASDSDEQGH
jgi:hypothetical protein